jgi:hypothetical protein
MIPLAGPYRQPTARASSRDEVLHRVVRRGRLEGKPTWNCKAIGVCSAVFSSGNAASALDCHISNISRSNNH